METLKRDRIVKPSRSKNPGRFWTRKAAVTEAIRRCEADSARTFNKRGTWFVIGSDRSWYVTTLKPTNSVSYGPITTDNVDKYRKWYL
jgi:hypothetical protein